MDKIINFLVPNNKNNYSPIITRSKTIFIFALVVFTFNITFNSLGFGQVKAAITINDLVALHNQERQARGLQPLAINSLLNSSAQNKAEAMLASNCWSHYCPNGKSPWEFFNEVGYVYIYAGENLAHGFSNAESVMQAWMNSPTHRANVLKSEFEEVGIGIAYGSFQGQEDNIVIAVHFGTRIPAKPDENPQVTQPGSPLYKPIVKEPQENSYQKDNAIPVIGTAEGAERVDIYNHNVRIGGAPVGGGIFTYRPAEPFDEGEQEIKIQSFIGDRGSQLSEIRKFIVDTVPPQIVNNTIEATGVTAGRTSTITLSLVTNEALSVGKFVINQEEFEFLTSGELTWQSEVSVELLDDSGNLQVIIIDLAGNQTVTDFSFDSIIGLQNQIDELKTLNERVINLNSFNDVFAGLRENNLKAQINLVFILISIVIISIDFIALKRTGFTGFNGKQHLHMTNFIVLFLVILIGGLNGELLEGINIRL